MWLAITQIVVGLLMLSGLYYWLSKRSAKAKQESAKNNPVDELLASGDATNVDNLPKKATSK